MKLGLQLGYWGARPPANLAQTVSEAERLGYDSVWTAEAYGSDALTPLAWIAAGTSKIRLGSGICQISARTPTAMAMAALTLDHLSEGRFMLGLGVSGPQVVEGWYGQPFDKPLARTREYIDIIRQVLKREAPVGNAGPHYPLPYPADAKGSWGLGKPLKSITHARRADLPIFLGAEGPSVSSSVICCISVRPLVRGKARSAGNGLPHCQGAQRGHGPRGERPSGASAARHRFVAALGNAAGHSLRAAPRADAPPKL